MDKPNGYDSVYVGGGRKMKRYLVYIDNILYGETTAVSPEKAANNIRYQIYEESTAGGMYRRLKHLIAWRYDEG